MPVYGLLFDQSLCIGCKACEQACQAEHGQAPHEAVRLDQDSFNWVQQVGPDTYMRHFCKHCVDPACVSVCPVAALQKTAQGPVVWVAERCLGCRYCMMACPFQVPKYEWHSVNPRIRKCDLCVHRLKDGRPTACASICPTGATTFGLRDDLLREGRRRLREGGSRYTNGLFGEVEVGGTSVLMLLTRDRKTNALPERVPEDALPKLTWKVLEKLPLIIPVWAAFLGGMFWLTERKNELAGEAGGPKLHERPVHRGDADEHE